MWLSQKMWGGQSWPPPAFSRRCWHFTITPIALAFTLTAVSHAQSRATTQGAHRMEVTLERLDGSMWRAVDPGLVLAEGDRVRFKYRTNVDGYLYVIDIGTSGKSSTLFPNADTGQDNHVTASKDYQIPASDTAVFRIAGPAGYDVVTFIVNPHKGGVTSAGPPRPKPNLIPRCDDTLLRARGACIDSSAGPKPNEGSRDLVFMREGQQTVVSSPTPLTAPVVYHFLLAHK
jgi:hypothetical protein